MEMYNPPHPGGILLRQVLPNVLKMTISDFAVHIGLPEEVISSVLHGEAPISSTLASGLEKLGVCDAELWLTLQAKYDLWQAEHKR